MAVGRAAERPHVCGTRTGCARRDEVGTSRTTGRTQSKPEAGWDDPESDIAGAPARGPRFWRCGVLSFVEGIADRSRSPFSGTRQFAGAHRLSGWTLHFQLALDGGGWGLPRLQAGRAPKAIVMPLREREVRPDDGHRDETARRQREGAAPSFVELGVASAGILSDRRRPIVTEK